MAQRLPDVTLSTLSVGDRELDPPFGFVEGTRVGRYEVGAQLGAGGMGIVYSAWDSELERDVALKVLRPRREIDSTREWLRSEAKAMAKVSHPNVVPVFDIGSYAEHMFIAMELISGSSLRAWAEQPRSWREVVHLFVSAGKGLAAAHANELLHRDFKPDNVMVDRAGEPHITDFGLAREIDVEIVTDDGERLAGQALEATGTARLAGTPAYMAPEVLQRQPADASADQYAFCVSLYELLYAVRPFAAPSGDLRELLGEIRAGRIVKPSRGRSAPRWLHAAIVRGLAFDPEQRWPSMMALVAALERGLKRRQRMLGGVAAIGVAAVVGVVLWSGRPEPGPRCLDVALKGNDSVAVLVCKDEYTRTGDPLVGARLANALRRTKRLSEAKALAQELVATEAQGDAYYTLGMVAKYEDRIDDARRDLGRASEVHRRAKQWDKSAADLETLAGLSDDHIVRLSGLAEAIVDAHRGNAARIEAYARIATADVLSEIGARRAALAALSLAEPLVNERSDRLWVEFQRGNVHQNLGEHALAVEAFKRARLLAEGMTNARRALDAQLNATFSLAESGRLDEARANLAAANSLDPANTKQALRLWLEALIAYRAGELDRAAGLAEQASEKADAAELEDLIEIEQLRGEIAFGRSEFSLAESWAHRAIQRVEALRSKQAPVELRSWMVMRRRIPYELLFASRAARHDAAGALVAFEQYRGTSVLAGLIYDAAAAGPDEFPGDELARLLPALASSALASPGPADAILTAARSSSLLVFVVARDVLWRITADNGALEVSAIGPMSALRSHVDRLGVAPDDRDAATALGASLLPSTLGRKSDRVLHVLLDEPLATLPVAVLRIGERRLFDLRPLVFPARVADVRCVQRPPPRRLVVIGANASATWSLPKLVTDATRSSLQHTEPGDLVHLAVLGSGDSLGDALVFADGRLRSLELAAQPHVPAQVVLAVPDLGLRGSAPLAMALLAAGADQVIASIRPISRDSLQRSIDRLYRSDVTDLARSLTTLQRDAHDNLGLAAFGRAACNE